MPPPDALSFIVFSDDWGLHPSSCQHLFRAVAHHHAVLWVNTVGMRRPRFSKTDLLKAATKLRRMWRGPEAGMFLDGTTGAVEIVQPAQLPIPGSRLVDRLNSRSAARAVAERLSARLPTDTVIVSTVPNAARAAALIPAALRVYYCVDDFALWPGHERQAVEEMELEMVRCSNLLCAPTPELAGRRIFGGRTAHLLPHGVDLDHFSSEKDVAAGLALLPAPRAGFIGLMDDRVDQELVARLATAMPEWTFVFAGPTTISFATWDALPNVHRIGPVAYQSLPEVIAGLDVLLLPYRVNELTRSLAPLKLREYIASGKPVVSCDIPAAESLGTWVKRAYSLADWTAGINASLGVDLVARRNAARAALAADSWADRAATFLALCREHLPRRVG